jgi:hypothetical protein
MVRATDHGTPPLSNTLPVHILLTMADDAPPRFIKTHYAQEVYENVARGKSILTVEARGRSSLHYEITSGNEDSTFVINPSTGNIMTQRSLDFERTHFYNLTVSVSNLVIIFLITKFFHGQLLWVSKYQTSPIFFIARSSPDAKSGFQLIFMFSGDLNTGTI